MSKFVVLILCCLSSVLGSPVPVPSAVTDGGQTFIPLCDKILCPVPSCENPVRPNGQCCATCGDEEEGECKER